jgi:hypothetical protein
VRVSEPECVSENVAHRTVAHYGVSYQKIDILTEFTVLLLIRFLSFLIFTATLCNYIYCSVGFAVKIVSKKIIYSIPNELRKFERMRAFTCKSISIRRTEFYAYRRYSVIDTLSYLYNDNAVNKNSRFGLKINCRFLFRW